MPASVAGEAKGRRSDLTRTYLVNGACLLCAAVVLHAVAYSQRARAEIASPQFRAYVKSHHACLGYIIQPESHWDTTVDYGGGHGNVWESYGLGQANPGVRMSTFGRDWRTNPYTQLRWMISYAVGRYGSECGAWSFWRAHFWW